MEALILNLACFGKFGLRRFSCLWRGVVCSWGGRLNRVSRLLPGRHATGEIIDPLEAPKDCLRASVSRARYLSQLDTADRHEPTEALGWRGPLLEVNRTDGKRARTAKFDPQQTLC
jgi:hypothetical protein